MNRVSADDLILKNISIDRFVAYLKKSGWIPLQHPNERILLFEGPVDDDGTPLQLILPSNIHFQDANTLFAEALNLITVLTQKSPDSIVESIKENGDGEKIVVHNKKIKWFVDRFGLSGNDVKILEKNFDPEQRGIYDFKDWYRSPEGRFFKYLVMFLTLVSFIFIAVNIVPSLDITSKRPIFYITEVVFIIVIALNIFLFPNFKLTSIDEPDLKAASGSTKMFLRFWVCLWLSWFCLYSMLALMELTGKRPFVLLLINVLNNLSGVFMFSMYYEMAARTENHPSSRRNKLFYFSAALLIILLMLEVALSRYLPQTVGISYLFSFISGIISGVATGLLVISLASRLINLPLWAVMSLTFYAVIQLAFPILTQGNNFAQENNHPELLVSVIMVAFYGKVFLLAIVHWAKDTNRLFFHMAATRKNEEEENELQPGAFFNWAITELEKGSSQKNEEHQNNEWQN